MVRALRDGDQSQWSNLADVWVENPEPTLAPEPEPDPDSLAPANLAAEIVDDEVRLSWRAPAQDAESVTGYEVERVFEPEPGITNVQAIPTGSVATVLDRPRRIRPGTTYACKVRAERADEWSRVVLHRIAVAGEPGSPANLRATQPLVSGGNTLVRLTWDDAANATSYTVFRSPRLLDMGSNTVEVDVLVPCPASPRNDPNGP